MSKEDLAIGPDSEHQGTNPSESLRLCTTHLESLWVGKRYHLGQLALVSTLLKGTPSMGTKVVWGLVRGDMNAMDGSEHELHKIDDIDLKDIWENKPLPAIPVLRPGKKDLTYGRARGNTWSYRSVNVRRRKRFDKSFYAGSLSTVALKEAQDVAGAFRRLGIGLKTEVEA